MNLRLHFALRTRLWAEVVHSRGERVFVATTEALKPGDAVLIDVEAPEVTGALSLSGVVVSLRPAVANFPAGVQVNLDEASVKRCELAIGAQKEVPFRTAARLEQRADCSLAARVLSPSAVEGCTVRNLSANGLTLQAAVVLQPGAEVSLSLSLPEIEVLLSAQVMWARDDLALLGLKVTAIDPAHASKVADFVQRALENVAPPKTSAPTVVVADDDPSILDFMSRVLTKAGCRVVRADRGDTALELVRLERPVMVFLDVLMPGADGFEVCRAIRADAVLKSTPVVLLSAMGEDRLVATAATVQASATLTKPMRIDAVRALLEKYVRVATAP